MGLIVQQILSSMSGITVRVAWDDNWFGVWCWMANIECSIYRSDYVENAMHPLIVEIAEITSSWNFCMLVTAWKLIVTPIKGLD